MADSLVVGLELFRWKDDLRHDNLWGGLLSLELLNRNLRSRLLGNPISMWCIRGLGLVRDDLLRWDLLGVRQLIRLSLRRVDRLIRLSIVTFIIILFGFILIVKGLTNGSKRTMLFMSYLGALTLLL